MFKPGFSGLEEKLENRAYISVHEFSKDFGAALNDGLALTGTTDAGEAPPVASGNSPSKSAISDLKAKKALAKRIIKAVQGSLQDAVRSECELRKRSLEKDLMQLNTLLEQSMVSRRASTSELPNGEGDDEEKSEASAILRGGDSNHVDRTYEDNTSEDHAIDPAITNSGKKAKPTSYQDEVVLQQQSPGYFEPLTNGINGDEPATNGVNGVASLTHDGEYADPETVSGISESVSHSFNIPWYMANFHPRGTTIQEEHWTGRELVRGMSEDLSDMDEEELSGLMEVDEGKGASDLANGVEHAQAEAAALKKRKAVAAARRRKRMFR